MEKKQPIESVRVGNISAAIFERKIEKTKKNAAWTAKTVVLTKSYKDKAGVWQNMRIGLNKKELMPFAQVLAEIMVKEENLTAVKELAA